VKIVVKDLGGYPKEIGTLGSSERILLIIVGKYKKIKVRNMIDDYFKNQKEEYKKRLEKAGKEFDQAVFFCIFGVIIVFVVLHYVFKLT
jgi:hypothetical protein